MRLRRGVSVGLSTATWLALGLTCASCSRADLYAITGGGGGAGAEPQLTASPGVGGVGTPPSVFPNAGGEAGLAGASPGNENGGTANAGGVGGTAGTVGAGGHGGGSQACPVDVRLPGDELRTLDVDGVTRQYILHVPEAYDGTEAMPLVVDFHGLGLTGEDELETSPYPEYLADDGVIMAFPDGLSGPLGPAWNVGPCCVEPADDIAFARALVADAGGQACVDPSQVYAVGVLTGGGMAHYVGCHAADLFAGVSPAAFDLLEDNVSDCVPSRPLPVVMFRSLTDDRVPYEGGPSSLVPGMPLTFLGAQETFDTWAEINGCTGDPSATDADGCSNYSNCAGGVEVVLCTQTEGTGVPGDPAIAWPILQRHRL